METPVPFFTTTMPPAVITLMTMFDAGSREVSKDVLEPDPAAPVSEQYQAAWASYWIAEYCLKKRQPGKVSTM